MIKSRRLKWTGHVARVKAKRNACKDFIVISEENTPLGRSRR
jgi:hypothetical protein